MNNIKLPHRDVGHILRMVMANIIIYLCCMWWAPTHHRVRGGACSFMHNSLATPTPIELVSQNFTHITYHIQDILYTVHILIILTIQIWTRYMTILLVLP